MPFIFVSICLETACTVPWSNDKFCLRHVHRLPQVAMECTTCVMQTWCGAMHNMQLAKVKKRLLANFMLESSVKTEISVIYCWKLDVRWKPYVKTSKQNHFHMWPNLNYTKKVKGYNRRGHPLETFLTSPPHFNWWSVMHIKHQHTV